MYVCVCVYTHNTYTPYTHIYYIKTFILDAINHDLLFDSTNNNNNNICIYVFIIFYPSNPVLADSAHYDNFQCMKNNSFGILLVS